MKRKIVPYNPRLKERARYLRQHMTRAEIRLWQHLKTRQMEGQDFDRQRPIDEYIVDFFCKDLMLAIEIDGVTHDSETGQRKDQQRQKRLEALGVRFLRFQDEEVKQNLEGVLTGIREWVRKRTVDNDSSAERGQARGKPTPAFGHPSQEGIPAAPSPPRRGAATRRGGSPPAQAGEQRRAKAEPTPALRATPPRRGEDERAHLTGRGEGEEL